MDVLRRTLVALMVVAFSLTAAACTAEGEVGEDGAGVNVEGEGGEGGGEGGDD